MSNQNDLLKVEALTALCMVQEMFDNWILQSDIVQNDYDGLQSRASYISGLLADLYQQVGRDD